MEFFAKNTNDLASQMYEAILLHGKPEDTRNGKVLRFNGPTTVTLTHPWERVNFSPARDCNPFFHLIESVAMLAAFNNAPFLAHFAKNIINYSDDKETFNAFYGSRARDVDVNSVMPLDQLKEVVNNLKNSPDSRQEVVNLSVPEDLVKRTKDKACNLCMIFYIDQISDEVIMQTFNRSNDMVWGFVTGANIVHFSYFHQYVANCLDRPMGPWHHTSANMHAYQNEQFDKVCAESHYKYKMFYESTRWDFSDPYMCNKEKARLFPVDQNPDHFDKQVFELCLYMEQAITQQRTLDKAEVDHLFFSVKDLNDHIWLRDTVVPVFNAWQLRKVLKAETSQVLVAIDRIADSDWRTACQEWVLRRDSK